MSTQTITKEISNAINSVNMSSMTIEQLKDLQKQLSDAKKKLTPTKEKTIEEINRKDLAVDIMTSILGFNAAYNVLKKRVNFENNTILIKDKEVSFAAYGIKDIERFTFLTKSLKNVTLFYPKNQTQITAQSLINKIVSLCSYDSAKFASLQRAAMKRQS
jgi:arsenate reductase-like glutaredoxin family protein